MSLHPEVVGQHHVGSDSERLGVVVVEAFAGKLIYTACTYVCIAVAVVDFEHGREGREAFVVEAFAEVICSEWGRGKGPSTKPALP